MRETAFGTGDAPGGDGFGYWSDLMRRGFAPMRTFTDDPDTFVARQRLLELGDVQVWQVDAGPSGMERDGRLVRVSDPETACVYVTRRGRMIAETAGRTADCGPGDLYLHDTTHPSRLRLIAPSGGGPFQALALMVPRSALPLAGAAVDRAVGLRAPADDGVAVLLAGFLSGLLDEGTAGALRPDDGPRLGAVARDLVAAMVARSLDGLGQQPPAESRERVLAVRVREFVLHNLADPDLDPAAVAAAHQVSVSHLYRIFRCDGMTLARWIRHQRLERARRDLADPALRGLPVHVLATRWGFRHASDFTRAFRAAYGLPPRDHRARALLDGPPAPVTGPADTGGGPP